MKIIHAILFVLTIFMINVDAMEQNRSINNIKDKTELLESAWNGNSVKFYKELIHLNKNSKFDVNEKIPPGTCLASYDMKKPTGYKIKSIEFEEFDGRKNCTRILFANKNNNCTIIVKTIINNERTISTKISNNDLEAIQKACKNSYSDNITQTNYVTEKNTSINFSVENGIVNIYSPYTGTRTNKKIKYFGLKLCSLHLENYNDSKVLAAGLNTSSKPDFCIIARNSKDNPNQITIEVFTTTELSILRLIVIRNNLEIMKCFVCWHRDNCNSCSGPVDFRISSNGEKTLEKRTKFCPDPNNKTFNFLQSVYCLGKGCSKLWNDHSNEKNMCSRCCKINFTEKITKITLIPCGHIICENCYKKYLKARNHICKQQFTCGLDIFHCSKKITDFTYLSIQKNIPWEKKRIQLDGLGVELGLSDEYYDKRKKDLAKFESIIIYV